VGRGPIEGLRLSLGPIFQRVFAPGSGWEAGEAGTIGMIGVKVGPHAVGLSPDGRVLADGCG